jgi:hypothetical protein
VTTLHAAFLLVALSVAVASGATQTPAPDDGKREFTISGCLLRSGYAGYQVDEARMEAIDGKTIADPAAKAGPGLPTKWILDGGGNLGQRTGEKVEVVGRSDWQPRPASRTPDDEPERPPHLDVKSVKTLAPSC